MMKRGACMLAHYLNVFRFYILARRVSSWLRDKLIELEFEPVIQPFEKNGVKGYNIETTLKSTRGTGLDAIVLSAPFERLDLTDGNKGTYGFTVIISLLKYLETTEWRSKDTILVLYPGAFESVGINSWVDDYHNNTLTPNTWSRISTYKYINIIAAFCFDLDPLKAIDEIALLSEGSYGNLPNFDLISMPIKIFSRESMSNIVMYRESHFDWIPEEYKSLLPNHIYQSLVTLANYIWNMASGVPTGDHAYFSRYRIDSITLSTRTKNNRNLRGHERSTIRFTRSVEGIIRSLNNLVQPLHSSYYFYLLMSPVALTSIKYYMISFGLIIGGSVLYVVNTLFHSSGISMIYSVVLAMFFILSGALVYTTPYISVFLSSVEYLTKIDNIDIILDNYIYLSGALLSLSIFILYPLTRALLKGDTKHFIATHTTLKSVVLAYFCIFLSAVSLMNISFALVVSIAVIPIYTIFYLREPKNRLVSLINIVALVLVSPYALLYTYSIYFGVDANLVVRQVFEAYHQHGSLLYFFMTIIYLPMNLLAILEGIRGLTSK